MDIEEAIKYLQDNLNEWKEKRPAYGNSEIVDEVDNDYNAIETLLTAYEKEKEKNSNSIEKILADDFKRHIDSITIGNSITFPCGWIYKKDLLNLIDNIKWKR